MEHIIERMQDDNAGVSVKNVKTFMNKIPSVFTGESLTYRPFPLVQSIIILLVMRNRNRLDELDAEEPGRFGSR